MSLTNPNKVVTEQRLAEFYAAILPYLGGMPEALANKFAKGDLYSTTEKIVGCWTDGRPVYQKVINSTTPNCSTQGTLVSTLIDIGASISELVHVEGYQIYSGIYTPLEHNAQTLSSGALVQSYFVVENNSATSSTDRNKIKLFNSHTGWNGRAVRFIIQYTKTTDAANSFKYSSETDYSTDEHIIGTWIDGKPLYQKTISCGAMPNNTTKRVSLGLASTCRIKDIKGYSLKSDNSVTIPLPKLTVDTGPGNPNSVSLTILLVNSVWNASFSTGGDYSSYTTSYVTVQYTKS